MHVPQPRPTGLEVAQRWGQMTLKWAFSTVLRCTPRGHAVGIAAACCDRPVLKPTLGLCGATKFLKRPKNPDPVYGVRPSTLSFPPKRLGHSTTSSLLLPLGMRPQWVYSAPSPCKKLIAAKPLASSPTPNRNLNPLILVSVSETRLEMATVPH